MKWWRMIFETQFDAKKEENDGFWSEIEWGVNGFEREREIRNAEWEEEDE